MKTKTLDKLRECIFFKASKQNNVNHFIVHHQHFNFSLEVQWVQCMCPVWRSGWPGPHETRVSSVLPPSMWFAHVSTAASLLHASSSGNTPTVSSFCVTFSSSLFLWWTPAFCSSCGSPTFFETSLEYRVRIFH